MSFVPTSPGALHKLRLTCGGMSGVLRMYYTARLAPDICVPSTGFGAMFVTAVGLQLCVLAGHMNTGRALVTMPGPRFAWGPWDGLIGGCSWQSMLHMHHVLRGAGR